MADEPDPPGVLVTPRVVVADEVHHLDEDVLNLWGNNKHFHLLIRGPDLFAVGKRHN